MTQPVTQPAADAIDDLLAASGVTKQRTLVRRVLEAGLGLGTDEASRLNLKITASALEEMRAAFQLFEPFVGKRKVSIFGSARTQPGDPLSVAAETTARAFADDGWMVVTGAGPGIMEAAAQGAGPERSIGVSIRLPFEENPNVIIEHDDHHVAMKYFFTRKLMLVKESSAFICLPGGFGTMDETYELLTLQQTGKMVPVPIVLLGRPGDTYWPAFKHFIVAEIEGAGFTSPGDLDRVLITESAEEAVAHVGHFWSNYQDLRWFPAREIGSDSDHDTLVLYTRRTPSAQQIASLNERFAYLLQEGEIELIDPYPSEGSTNADLARLKLILRPRSVGDLFHLIRALNDLPQEG